MRSRGGLRGGEDGPYPPVRAGDREDGLEAGSVLGLGPVVQVLCRSRGPLSGANYTRLAQELGKLKEDLGTMGCGPLPHGTNQPGLQSVTVRVSRTAAAPSGSPDLAPDLACLAWPLGNVVQPHHGPLCLLDAHTHLVRPHVASTYRQ